MSSNFIVYLIGFFILTVGLALAAHLLGAPPMWIGVGVICFVGIGILSAVKKTQNQPPPPNQTGSSSDRPPSGPGPRPQNYR